MKMKLLSIATLQLCLLLTVAPFQTACKSSGEVVTNTAESADQIILRAEQTAEAGKATLNLFVHVERDNEAALRQINPQIHVFAEMVRRNGINWIRSLRDATKTFKSARTAANQASLQTWIATLNASITKANTYLQEAKPVTQP